MKRNSQEVGHFLLRRIQRLDLRANRKSISHRCHRFQVACVWELTKETIHLPLGCLQGGQARRRVSFALLHAIQNLHLLLA